MLVLGPWAWILALTACVSPILWRWLLRQRKKCFTAFEGTGIPVPPIDSLISGHADAFLNKTQFELVGQWLKEYGDVFGFFLGDVPFVVIKDADMINDIFAQEFRKFSERGNLLHIYEFHPLFTGNLIFTKGSEWKDTRNAMAQFFTLAKMKSVMPSLIDAQHQFLEILGGIADAGTEFDIGSRLERLTFDVVSKAAFGIDTHVQESTDNPLFQTAIQCFPNIMKGIFYNCGQNLYHWSWILRASLKILDPFFKVPLAVMANKAKDVIEFRRLNPQVNLPDMAQILLDNALKDMGSAEEIEGETRNIGPLPTKTLNYLATNVMDVLLAGFTTRKAEEDYQCGQFLIKKGMSVMVPTYNLHHDPQYWTDPWKFDPERFSPDNKHLINPAVYQPFGLGIRVCVGQRLALVEMASVTAHVLRHFRITLGPSQKADLELITCAFLVLPKEPIRIKLHRL